MSGNVSPSFWVDCTCRTRPRNRSCFACSGVTTSNASRDDDDHSAPEGDIPEDEADEMEEVVVDVVEDVVEDEDEVEEDDDDDEDDDDGTDDEDDEEEDAMEGRAMPMRERERRPTVLEKSLLPIQTRIKRAQAMRMTKTTRDTS